MSAELFIALSIFVAGMALISTSVAIVYIFGGKKARKAIRDSW